MQDFVHLHVHTQYSILDGQASIPRLVDKAIADGMRGLAITDHGNMMGIKEFFNYTEKVRGKARGAIKAAQAQMDAWQAGTEPLPEGKTLEEALEDCRTEIAKQQPKADFKPIFGCEMYVARRGDKALKQERIDQSGWHLIVLAKNEHGYHNLVKLVSRS